MEKEKRIIAYKGFDENLCCIGFQYKVGEEYVEIYRVVNRYRDITRIFE